MLYLCKIVGKYLNLNSEYLKLFIVDSGNPK